MLRLASIIVGVLQEYFRVITAACGLVCRGRAVGVAPVTWRCTRYVALHPLRSAAPEQKGCIAYGSGALPLITSESVVSVRRGDCAAQRAGLPRTEGWTTSHSIHSPLFVSLVIHRG